MKIPLSAVGNRTPKLTVVAALVLAALQTASPAVARSASSTAMAPLSQGAGMTGKPSDGARAVQRALRERGYALGAPGADGRFGPITAAAVRRFQSRAGLAVDGIVGPKTRRALGSAPFPAPLSQGVGMGRRPSVRVRHLQLILVRRGLDVGPPGADGRFGPRTADAVRRMQRTYRLSADAIVGPRTRRVIRLIADRRSAHREPASKRSDVQRPTNEHTSTTLGAVQSRATARPDPPGHSAASDLAAAPSTGGTLPFVAVLIAVLVSAAALAVVIRRGRLPGATSRLVQISRRLRGHDGSGGDRPRASDGHWPIAQLRRASDERRESRHRVDGVRTTAPVVGRKRHLTAPPARLSAGEPVIGYVTLDRRGRATPESLTGIDSMCAGSGWNLTEVVHDSETAGAFARPGLNYALERIATGHARGLVVGDVKDLAPSSSGVAALVEWFGAAHAVLIVPDRDLEAITGDSDTPASTVIALRTSHRAQATGPPGHGRAAVESPGSSGRSS